VAQMGEEGNRGTNTRLTAPPVLAQVQFPACCGFYAAALSQPAIAGMLPEYSWRRIRFLHDGAACRFVSEDRVETLVGCALLETRSVKSNVGCAVLAERSAKRKAQPKLLRRQCPGGGLRPTWSRLPSHRLHAAGCLATCKALFVSLVDFLECDLQ
jgi:hypothetical protein